MAGRSKGEGDQLLSLHDVREYLIDTNALKEAESLLISDDPMDDSGRDAAYTDSKTKALGQAASRGEGRLAYMRKRAQKNKADRKEEILDNLTGAGPQGKLNVLREEEEMKELLGIETALREESILLERERMSVAAQAESAKRSNLQQLESQMEQEMLQLELQRNNANKELDKKMSALESLTSEIQKVEVEMDSQFGSQAMKEREEKKKETETSGGSKKDHMDQMFELVKDHANSVVESKGVKMEAEDELSRLASAQARLKERGISNVDLDTIINTRPLHGSASKRDLSRAIPAELIAQLRDGDNLGPEAKRAADVLASMGSTLGLEGQQAQLEALKLQARKESEEQDQVLVDDAFVSAQPPVSSEASEGSDSSDGILRKGRNLQDSLDAWLNDDKAILNDSSGSAVPEAKGADMPTTVPRQGTRRSAPEAASSDTLSAVGGSSASASSKPPRQDSRVGDPRDSFESSTAGASEAVQGEKDSLTAELMKEIRRLTDEREEREKQMNEQLKKQQMQFQQQIQQIQQQVQGGGAGMPVGPQGYPAPGVGMGMGMGGYPQQVDPHMQQFMMQMQMMNQQIERENQAMMQQLGGGGLPYGQMQQNASPGGGQGHGAGGLYGNQLRRSGGSVFGSDYDAGLQAFHDRANRDGMADGELHIPLQRKQMHKVELKYADEIRVLNLEMEKSRKQVELDEFKYEAEKSKEMRRAEDEHAAWLEEQKKELQTLKMKQALAKEQRILNMQLGQLAQVQPPSQMNTGNSSGGAKAPSSQDQGGGDDLISMEEAGVGSLPIPLDLAGGVSALVDGLLLPDHTKLDTLQGSILEPITDASVFRVVIGVYDASGTCISRLANSNWQSFKASTVGLQRTLLDVEDGDPVKEEADANKGRGKDKKRVTGNDAADWLIMPVKRTVKKSDQELVEGLRVLAEIQFAPNQDSMDQRVSLGWGTFPLVGTEMGLGARGLPPNGQSDPGDLFVRNGFWRVHIRKGMYEPTVDPTVLPGLDGGYISAVDLPYYPNAFLLLRIGDSTEMQRQYAWQPADHPQTLPDSKAVRRLYKDPFAALEESRDSSQASLPQPSEKQAPIRGSRPASSASKAPAPRPGSTSDDSGDPSALVPVPEEEEEDNSADVAEASAYEKKKEMVGEAKAKVPWLLGVDPGNASEKYQRGDGVDIYVDGCMYLPDNTTITRVKIAFFTSEKEPCGPVTECFSSLEEVAISPKYDHKVELRGSSLNLTATCLLRFDTIDSASRRPATIGYSCFKVFATKDREQPESTNSPNVYINTGLFQLPIYGGKVAAGETFTEHMLDDMPKLPCASVLVRIKAAPHSNDGLSVLSREDVPEDQWQSLGLSSPAPEYMSGAYFGKLCEPSDLEALCYLAKAPNLSVSVDSTLNQLLSSSVEGGDAMTFPPRPDLQGKKGSKEQKLITDWTKSLMPPHSEMRRVLPYQYISPYSLDCGLNVSIDMLHNMPEAVSGFFSSAPVAVHKVIYSIVPPGLFYKDPPMSEGVFFTKSEDYGRCYRAPTFNDGFVHLYPPILDDSTYLLIEVRTVTIEGAKGGPGAEPTLTVERASDLDQSFWTLLPISSQATADGEPKYLVSGTYQLPLIKGSPPATDLFSSESQEPLDLVLERLGPKGKASAAGKKTLGSALKLSDGASVILRVCNPIFRHVLDFPQLEPHEVLPANLQTGILNAAVSVAGKGVTGGAANPANFKYVPERYSAPSTKYPSIKERLNSLNIVDLKKFSKNVNKTFAGEVNINMD